MRLGAARSRRISRDDLRLRTRQGEGKRLLGACREARPLPFLATPGSLCQSVRRAWMSS